MRRTSEVGSELGALGANRSLIQLGAADTNAFGSVVAHMVEEGVASAPRETRCATGQLPNSDGVRERNVDLRPIRHRHTLKQKRNLVFRERDRMALGIDGRPGAWLGDADVQLVCGSERDIGCGELIGVRDGVSTTVHLARMFRGRSLSMVVTRENINGITLLTTLLAGISVPGERGRTNPNP